MYNLWQTLNLLHLENKKVFAKKQVLFVSTISGILTGKPVVRIASGLAFKKKYLKKYLKKRKAQRPDECGILVQSEAISIVSRRSLSLLHVTSESWVIKSPVSFRYEVSFTARGLM